VGSIYNNLGYEADMYYLINMNQDLAPNKANREYENYPPTDAINLDAYSAKLGKTFWEAKLEVWEHYSHSIPDLEKLLNNTEKLQNNDRKEYFTRAE
jgi:hypothetical protein